ncbi:MAG TPA: Spy/CpxP family protein refolding chaperone [Polyangiaceae bacterium]|jgi:Spy/CpxP family protein refolding chaperone
MFLRNVAFSVALAASAVPFAACSASSNVGEPSTTAQSNTTTAPISVTVHGPAKRVADALGQVPLRADQRVTIEQMAKDSEARMEPVRKARADVVAAIADQVQAGTIDRAALQPKIDALTAAHQAVEPQNRAALEKLHDLLTPEQRAQFVTAMQAERHEGRAHHRGEMHGRMQKWATDLNLTQDQQDKIREKIRAEWQTHIAGAVVGTDAQKTDAVQDGQMLARGHAMHEQMKNVLEAFKGDKFSMDQVAPLQPNQAMGKQFAGRMLDMLDASLPILTQDQRATAAQKLRARATTIDEEEETAPAPAAQ